MKLFTSVILIFLLTLQSFSPVVMYACYFANKDYVAGMLCENRNRPAMHCEGKCFLKKQLHKAEQEDGKEKSSAKIIEVCVYIAATTIGNDRAHSIPPRIQYPPFHPGHYAYNYHYSCFHPPCI